MERDQGPAYSPLTELNDAPLPDPDIINHGAMSAQNLDDKEISQGLSWLSAVSSEIHRSCCLVIRGLWIEWTGMIIDDGMESGDSLDSAQIDVDITLRGRGTVVLY